MYTIPMSLAERSRSQEPETKKKTPDFHPGLFLDTTEAYLSRVIFMVLERSPLFTV